jgi:choline dehydrogenase-like flavoprotein
MSLFPDGPGKIFTGADVVGDVEEKPDVCVVGSGAGGAVVAARLAEKGLSVVVLEDGGFFTAKDFNMQESWAYPHLYQQHGNLTTADVSVAVLQGRGVGGSTTVNYTSSFRTPPRVFEHWRKVHGVEGIDAATLAPHWDAVEKRLSIHEQPLEEVNRNNGKLWEGAKKLGFKADLIRRNVKKCMNSGYCGMGCPVNAKQGALITFIPDALRKGAKVYANAFVARVETSGKRAVAVHAQVRHPQTDQFTGRTIVVRPRLVVLAAGALNTPMILLRSGLDENGQVGKRTFIHPVTGVGAVYSDNVEAYYGAPQSVSSHAFAERGADKVGFFLEASPAHPLVVAVAGGGTGPDHQAVMAKLPRFSSLIMLAIDGFLPQEEGGTVTLRGDGRMKFDYPIRSEVWEALREGSKMLARVHLAAGAEEAFSLHADPVRMKTEKDVAKLDDAAWQPNRVPVYTAHLMGGACMGKDPEKSVVDSRLKHHRLENLYVVDGSVFPTSVGVNPSETIYGLAHWASEHLV